MTDVTLIAIVSVFTAGITVAIGAGLAALGEGRAVAEGLRSIAQQPDETASISRAMFVGLAMIETSAIYCFVISLILIFANPFWRAAGAG
ncbi:MAG TPA: F0F1 ATP synthase subunit C [Zeimonas sp.]|nr:F0F1 ATP synthase subunit C [Zeimonas sp.]